MLEIEPEDGEALQALENLLQQQGQWPELIEVLRRQLSLADDPIYQATLLLKIAKLQREALEDYEGALATYRRLLLLRPDDVEGLLGVEELCERLERWTEAAEAVEKARLVVPAAPPSPPEWGRKADLAAVAPTSFYRAECLG